MNREEILFLIKQLDNKVIKLENENQKLKDKVIRIEEKLKRQDQLKLFN